MSTPNPIIEELHRIREEISRESGDDMKKTAQAVNQKQTKANPPALLNLRPCDPELDQLRERGLLVVVRDEYSAAKRESARNVQHVEGARAELRRVLSAQLSGKIEHSPKGHIRE